MAEWEVVASQLESVIESLKSVTNAHTSLVGVVKDIRDGTKVSIDAVNDNVNETMDTFQDRLEELNSNVISLMKATRSDSMYTCEVERTKIPEPKAFRGVKDANEVDNFLFDMELFFSVTKRNSNEDKLMIIPLYLADDAKLWWCTKVVRAVPSPNQVTSWEIFKKELKAQFYPENVAYDARCKLGELQ